MRRDRTEKYWLCASLRSQSWSSSWSKFLVAPLSAEAVTYADISCEPTDLPLPIDRREPQTVRVDLIAVELEVPRPSRRGKAGSAEPASSPLNSDIREVANAGCVR